MLARGRFSCVMLLALAVACAEGGGGGDDADASPSDGSVRRDGGRDAGRRDAGFDAGRPRDAGFDAGGGDDAGAADASAPDAGTVDSGGGGVTCAPAEGALHIVEVMVSSLSGFGDRGEWFEVVNIGTCTIDLTGVQIASPNTGGTEVTHDVSGGTVAPGQHFVFAMSGDGGDNHLLDHDYVYGASLVLDNAADWIELRYEGTTLDRVGWPSTGFTHSRARQFPPSLAETLNDNWSAWCNSTEVYSDAGGTFYGTPQAENVACP